MSTRENIASNLLTVISNISSPDVRKATRQPFPIDELSQAQYPAVVVQTSEETNIDTKRNELITAIETAIETDITRNGNALDTMVVSCETDEGSLFPVGAIRMTIRCMYEYQSGTP